MGLAKVGDATAASNAFAACRRLCITHIIEEGRYGGLSALIYALHGFKVTALSVCPLSQLAVAFLYPAKVTYLSLPSTHTNTPP